MIFYTYYHYPFGIAIRPLLENKICAGNLQGADAFDYLRGKGLRGIYSNIAFY